MSVATTQVPAKWSGVLDGLVPGARAGGRALMAAALNGAANGVANVVKETADRELPGSSAIVGPCIDNVAKNLAERSISAVGPGIDASVDACCFAAKATIDCSSQSLSSCFG